MEAAAETTTPSTSTGTLQLIQLIKLQYSPDVIFVSSRAETQLVEALRAPLPPALHHAATTAAAEEEDNLGNPNQQQQQPFPVYFERNNLFNTDQAKRCLEAVHITGMPPRLSPRDRLHYLNTMIHLSNQQQVCAVGALLAILDRESILQQPPQAHDQHQAGSGGSNTLGLLCIASLKEASLDGLLMVDPASLEALHIFSEESHPSGMGIGRAKEGMSVFGIMNRCVTAMGRRLMRLWFARPLLNITHLEQRLDAVETLVKLIDVVAPLKTALRQVKDPSRQFIGLQSMQTLPDAELFLQLQRSFAALFRTRDIVQEILAQCDATDDADNNNKICLLRSIASSISDDLAACHTMITNVIDPSQAPDGFKIHHGVSDELDSLKQMYYGLPDLMTAALHQELQRIPRSIAALAGGHTWRIMYLPQVGFVLAMRGARLPDSVADCLPDYCFAFEDNSGGSGNDGALGDVFQVGDGGEQEQQQHDDNNNNNQPQFYYHTDSTRELNSQFGDIIHRIRDMENTVCVQLVKRLHPYHPSIQAAAEAVAELDCILSLATVAVELNLTRPQLTTDNVLTIKGGRHLLTELLVDQYIPNDTDIQVTTQRVNIVTGPNYSGKSSYAKQVAVITFLSQIGSFVPAQHALVGLTDRIFTRVVSRESTSIPQSTFMIDLSQIASMLQLSTPSSLCIIDEFGKGTLASDGIGLLCSVLHHFASLGADAPKVILCTHFTEVLETRYLPRNPTLGFYTMNVMLDGGEQENGDGGEQENGEAPEGAAAADNLVFLYKLVPGYVDASFGLHCAKLAGLPCHVVQRSGELIACQVQGQAFSMQGEGSAVANQSAVFTQLVEEMKAVDVSDAGAAKEFAIKVLTVTG